MTVTPSSPVVGIFKDRLMAEQAIDALHTAGFTSEQVRYSAPGTSGSILADLKSLFTGQSASSGTIANDLTDMGLSNEDAQYYSREHTNGNTILAVSASGREQEVLTILHQYGAYNAHTGSSSATPYTQQSSDYAQQPANPIDGTGLQEQHASSEWTTQSQSSDADNYPLQSTSQNATSPYSEVTTPDTQPDQIATNQNPEYQPTQPLTPGYHSTNEASTDEQTTPSDSVTPEDGTIPADSVTPVRTSDAQTTPSDSVTPGDVYNDHTTSSEYVAPATTPEDSVTSSDAVPSSETPEDQTLHSDAITPVATSDVLATPSEYATPTTTPEDQTTPELQTTPPENVSSDSSSPIASSDAVAPDSTSGTTTAEPADEFQQLQEQLQAAQQQLQDARAQLQAAKDHEAQLQTIKEREKKLQEARQQLQDIQAQIEATMAELHETHGRISQYS
ncbi:MAG: hypothetical protein H0V70_02435 [Ktedonobacteraceae bacterium]|nr:hypothetical protein [Ktedonobacteraceae bacterium]